MRAAALTLCLLVAACGSDEPREEYPPPSPEPRPFRAGIRFDPDTAQTGRRIGNLTLDSLVRRGPATGQDADIALFRGEVELSGSTMRHPDADLSQTSVCFEADSASASRLPRMTGDERRAWFCFSNGDFAAGNLAQPAEVLSAVVVVDSFTIVRGYSDEVNRAHLVRVLGRTRPVFQPDTLIRAAERIVAFLTGDAPFEEITLEDSVSIHLAPEGGGTHVRVPRDALRERQQWRVRSPDGRTVYSLVPPRRDALLVTSPGRHLNCREQELASLFPELARLPHVGAMLQPPAARSCLQAWNATFVFAARGPRPSLTAVVYDQWEW